MQAVGSPGMAAGGSHVSEVDYSSGARIGSFDAGTQSGLAQSLGDLARQLRSQKSTAQPKTVITNDDLPSDSAVTSLGLEKPVDPASSTKPGTDSSPLASLAQWESVVKQIDAMDRATLLKLALHGANPDFPGHGNWEERLFTAKQTYVSQGRDLLQRARNCWHPHRR